MKRVIEYQNGKAIVMWNETPMTSDYQREWHCMERKTKTTEIAAAFEIGVELEIHTGGRICYGFLAARVRPHNEPGIVKISIAFTSGNTVRYENSCLLNDSFVYKGLPKEYVTQVGESMAAAVEGERDYPQCEILVDSSANCEVGSSPVLFGIIAEMLVKLICVASAEQVMEMGAEAFALEFADKLNLRV